MYKFVRYEQKLGNTTYKSDWMFVPQNLNDVEDFHKQYVLNICNKEFEDCVKSVVKYGNNSFVKNTEKQFFNCILIKTTNLGLSLQMTWLYKFIIIV